MKSRFVSKHRVRNFLCLIAAIMIQSSTFATAMEKEQSLLNPVHEFRRQNKILFKLSKFETINYVNPILEHLASTLEKNETSLFEIGLKLDHLIHLHESYKLGGSMRRQQFANLLEESKFLRNKFSESKTTLSDSEKLDMMNSLKKEKINTHVLELLENYKPNHKNLNLYGFNATGGLGWGGFSFGMGAGTAGSSLGKRNIRVGLALGPAQPAVGIAASFGKIASNTKIADGMISLSKDHHMDFAFGVGASAKDATIQGGTERSMPNLSNCYGVSIGFGGGESSRHCGAIQLPIPLKRNYAMLRNSIGLHYTLEMLSSEAIENSSESIAYLNEELDTLNESEPEESTQTNQESTPHYVDLPPAYELVCENLNSQHPNEQEQISAVDLLDTIPSAVGPNCQVLATLVGEQIASSHSQEIEALLASAPEIPRGALRCLDEQVADQESEGNYLRRSQNKGKERAL
jgi:hypothetical protein